MLQCQIDDVFQFVAPDDEGFACFNNFTLPPTEHNLTFLFSGIVDSVSFDSLSFAPISLPDEGVDIEYGFSFITNKTDVGESWEFKFNGQ